MLQISFEKGGLVNNNVEQIKYTAAFLLSSFIMGFQQGRLDLFYSNSFFIIKGILNYCFANFLILLNRETLQSNYR